MVVVQAFSLCAATQGTEPRPKGADIGKLFSAASLGLRTASRSVLQRRAVGSRQLRELPHFRLPPAAWLPRSLRSSPNSVAVWNINRCRSRSERVDLEYVRVIAWRFFR